MKQKIVTVTRKFQHDADICVELSQEELSTLVGEDWKVKSISSTVYFKPHGSDMSYQYVLFTLLLESIE